MVVPQLHVKIDADIIFIKNIHPKHNLTWPGLA